MIISETGRRRLSVASVVLTALIGLAGCGSDPSPDDSGPRPAAFPSTGTATVEVGGHQVTVHVPDSYQPDRSAPLVILLHGYSSNGAEQERYLKFAPLTQQRGFVYAVPEGLTDRRGNQYWNATDACCDFDQAGSDDSGYLSELIRKLQETYRTDARRVYLIGHSNGAFMAFRMACDHADQVTAIATLNGATWNDRSRCAPTAPVGVLDIHGTADETIAYAGGSNSGQAYPSAARTVADWLGHNGCADTGTQLPALDLVATLPGPETRVTDHQSGCAAGSSVRTWVIDGGSHVPAFNPTFAPAVLDHLLTQVKP